MRDQERITRIQAALQQAQLDAVVCALPANVLMTTGYWPVVGTSIAVTRVDGKQVVLAPEDEKDFAQHGWAEVRTYQPSSLDKLQSIAEAASGPLGDILRELGADHGRVGFEAGPSSEPASYAAMHVFGQSILDLVHMACPAALADPADDILAALAANKTPAEIERIRTACRIAEQAFRQGVWEISAGATEVIVASRFRDPLVTFGTGYGNVVRAEGFVFCMSGSNSALARGAYARSSTRRIEKGDLVLIHCNSCADGFWTDITRTYSLGEPGDRTREIYEAVFDARQAALQSIHPGVLACEVDREARQTLAHYGLDEQFKHSTGHGVGFAAISANARPRIHPKSQERLQRGMVFNVEPAVYIEGYGGIRHCDVVVVTDSGAEVLTPFHDSLGELVISPSSRDGRMIA